MVLLVCGLGRSLKKTNCILASVGLQCNWLLNEISLSWRETMSQRAARHATFVIERTVDAQREQGSRWLLDKLAASVHASAAA
jgi:hypothetical protein